MVEAALEIAGIPEGTGGKVSTKQIAAVVAGNALEFYDFLTYSFFAIQIGQTFFPSNDPGTSLLASLATFGVGFLTRPVGALVIGRLADRAGRKPAMVLSFSLMGFAIVGLALTPSYRLAGVIAPILAIAFRLVQGFALGGEVGPSTAYLIEAAPPGRRGFFASLQNASQSVAILCAGLIGVGLSNAMGPDALRDFGWRIAFLAGAVIIPLGLLLRRGLPETLHERTHEAVPDDVQSGSQERFRVVILALMMLASATTVTYVLNYLTTYATATLHMPLRLAFGTTVIVGSIGLCLVPVGGWLSDRFGRKPVMIVPWFLDLLLIVPCFYATSHFRNAFVLYGTTALLVMAGSIANGSMLVTITEALPKRIRSGALGLIYALAISIFGGSAQFNVAWLTRVTHNPLAPAWYTAVAIAVGLVAMSLMRENAPVKHANERG